MAAPIRDEHGGVVGIMVGEIELGLRNFMTETMSTPYGRTGGYLLIDRTAREIITATDRRRIMEKLPAPGVHPVIDHFLDGHEGTAILINRLGQEVLVANKGIRSADWIISVVAPTEEVFAPIAAMKQRLLGMTLILTLIGAALTWWFIRRQFAPLEQGLHSLAVMRQPGQPLTPLPVSREDEIGQLVGAFNALIAEVEVREKALRESDDCLRSILATSLDGFWRVSEEGRLLEVNETYARMSGTRWRSWSACTSRNWSPTSRRAWRRSGTRRFWQPGTCSSRMCIGARTARCGTWNRALPTGRAGGGQVRAFIRDISARKRDEARLREAERKFTALVQQSLVGVYVIRDATWLYINPQMARMLGYASPAGMHRQLARQRPGRPGKPGARCREPAAPPAWRGRTAQLRLHRPAQGWHAHRRGGFRQHARIRWAAGGARPGAGCLRAQAGRGRAGALPSATGGPGT